MSEQSQQPHPGGRPTLMTPGTVDKLVAAFQRNFSVRTACQIANIDHSTFYKWMKESKEFFDRIDGAQTYGKLLAGDIILDVLQDAHRGKKDPRTGEFIPKKYNDQIVVNTAWKYLEKAEKETYGSQSMLAAKLESDGKGGVTTTIVHATDGTFTDFFKQLRTNTGSEEINPGQLLEILESGSEGEDMAGGGTEEPAPPIHTEELQGEHPTEGSVPQP